MNFSLIIGTLNRRDALLKCIDSLLSQTYQDFEIIIIDQSDNDETQCAVNKIEDCRIKYKRVSFKGLSKARNEALRMATGNYFCLIDDDANYDSEYLSIAAENIDSRTILSGHIYDTIKQGDFVGYKAKYNKKELPLRMIIRTCPSAGLVFPMNMIQENGLFDERFGIGGFYGSAEETDLILRALKYGYRVKYLTEMILRHPVPAIKKQITPQKRKTYAEGLGALFNKHKEYKLLTLLRIEHRLRLMAKILVFKGEKKELAINEYNGFKEGYTYYIEK